MKNDPKRQKASQGKNDSWRQMLAAVPVKNVAADVDGQAKEIVVSVKTRKPWYFLPPISWIVPDKGERKVRLEDLGKTIWELCDGERSVEDIIDKFVSEQNLSFHEARVAVTQYLRILVKRGVLAIVMPQEPDSQEDT